MTATPLWSAQRLAEFLAVVASRPDETDAVRAAVEHVGETFEAEVSAFVVDGAVLASVGYPAGSSPDRAILAVAAGARTLDVPGAGQCTAVAVSLDDDSSLVVARQGDERFSVEEIGLLRAMARVLSLAVGMLRAVEAERAVVASLQERQRLFAELQRIERLIASHAPLQEVLDTITAAARALIGDEIIGLRLIDGDDPSFLELRSARGVDEALSRLIHRIRLGEGVAGRAALEQRLVVEEDYQSATVGYPPLQQAGVVAAMAAPVQEHGRVVGSLFVASTRSGRRYSVAESEALTALADHVSLALGDARTVEAMNAALDDAVHQALHDALTGLPNRTLFHDRVDHALARAARSGGRVAVLFIDLDNFKMVNDSMGHATGDELLVAVADRLLWSVRAADTAARLGGDEFAVLIEDVVSDADATHFAQRLLAALAVPFTLRGEAVHTSASIGIVLSEPGDFVGDLLRKADVAMYRAKADGKRRTAVFEPSMFAAIRLRLELENDLRAAIEREELRVEYQPVVDLRTGAIVAFEALTRWWHPDRGRIPPDEFIALAEETGLIVPLGDLVLLRACGQLRDWRDRFPHHAALGMSVNLSPRQLQQYDVAGRVRSALADFDLEPSALTLEITETVLMQDADLAAQRLAELHGLGVRLAVDDFGTGYSSLAYLRRFPVDCLKIDKAFVSGLGGPDAGDHSLVEAIVALGRTMRLETVAEGVEHRAQLRQLLALDCTLGQGYLFSPPVTPEAADILLAAPAGVTSSPLATSAAE